MKKIPVKRIVAGNGQEVYEEIKERLGLNAGDKVDISSNGSDCVVIKNVKPICVICNSREDLHTMGNKMIMCKKCLKAAAEVMFKGMSENDIKSIL